MCGLAGILHFDRPGLEAASLDRLPGDLEAMQRHLRCRGPDGEGTHIDGPCGLTHTRLAILDPAHGRQPMALNEPGDRTTVVFNGEIYNHRELRRQLESAGHRFTTDHSDTEVLLHGFRRWGLELPKRLEGMFAFALWDGPRRRLILARDRIGQKPLWVYRDGRRLVFASLIAALLPGLDTVPQVNRQALGHYLSLGFTDRASMLEGVVELPSGCIAEVSADGRFQQHTYWQPPSPTQAEQATGSEEAAHDALRQAVHRRLEADVPLGCFLSGGIDSSLVAAFAQAKCREQGRRLRTFSVAMPEERYDESGWARRVAEHLGTEHTELRAGDDGADLFADLRTIIRSCGEPLGDSSILPTHWISRAAREHVTVALSGDGGDELFAGYDRYRALRLLGRHRGWLRLVPSTPLRLGDPKSFTNRVCRFIDAARYRHPAGQYLSMLRIFSPPEIATLGLGQILGDDDHGRSLPTALPDWPAIDDPTDAARRWDLLNYLPFDLLRKVDRASMAVALEVRSPMLDSEVVNLAAHLPGSVLTPGGRSKGLLKGILRRYLPKELIDRPKMGFAVPIGSWLATSHRQGLREQLLENSALLGLGVDRKALEVMIDQHATGRRDHTHRLFTLLSLAMWLHWLEEQLEAPAAHA